MFFSPKTKFSFASYLSHTFVNNSITCLFHVCLRTKYTFGGVLRVSVYNWHVIKYTTHVKYLKKKDTTRSNEYTVAHKKTVKNPVVFPDL